MENIYYFNITYYCNNSCIFCFSGSTGSNRNQIEFSKYKAIIEKLNPNPDDKIIINGGEPSLHPFFYDIINWTAKKYSAKIVIYTNGVQLDISKIYYKDSLHFIIPVHGNSEIHNEITRNKNSFNSTIRNIISLDNNRISYGIKLIINNNIIKSNWNLYSFISQYSLHPDEIIFARLNKTKKSILNNVILVRNFDLKKYLKNYIKNDLNKFKIKLLDIPPCFIDNSNLSKYENINVPKFTFSDYKYSMITCTYLKKLMLYKAKCLSCCNMNICKIMENSYYTLEYNSKLNLVLE